MYNFVHYKPLQVTGKFFVWIYFWESFLINSSEPHDNWHLSCFLDAAGHNITLLHLLVPKVNLHKDVINLFSCYDLFLIYFTVYKYEHAFTKKEIGVAR